MMSGPTLPLPHLAPLQVAMLETSGGGHHVEQVELVFSPTLSPAKVSEAWTATVAATSALRLRFLCGNGKWNGGAFSGDQEWLDLVDSPPTSWDCWLAEDRARCLLGADGPPWRAVYWPEARRFVWTFHHALLDGRSMARVLMDFRARIAGGDPAPMELARWQPATTWQVEAARRGFSARLLENEQAAFPASPHQEPPGVAVRHLGAGCVARLESLAKSLDLTVPTIITWAWGRTLASEWQVACVVLEQLRAGRPQPDTAGFTMNTVPVVVGLDDRDSALQNLKAFRQQVLGLREVENVRIEDFHPAPAPNRSVIMVEHQTLAHQLVGEIIEAVKLHEAQGEALAATAHVLPDLRLVVEGPGRHRYLEAWTELLEHQICQGRLLA